MDKYKIDSHKLLYHPERVGQWLKGDQVFPIYMEISPIGACNHRCVFCGLDFMKYRNRRLEADQLENLFDELSGLGLKSAMLAGEGEPFLHPKIADIVFSATKRGIDIAISSNGVLFEGDKMKAAVDHCKWVKISIDAGTKETYARIHQTGQEDFQRMLDNIKAAADYRRRQDGTCSLGTQALLLPENSREMMTLAELVKAAGADYLVIKPYSQHPQSVTRKYEDIHYDRLRELKKDLDTLNDDSFHVVFRENAMCKWDDANREYQHCLALPFWSYIDAGGNVWGCSMFIEDDRFYYGNIKEESFQDIWNGERRKKSLEWVENEWDTSKCRVNCRMDEVNRYLWDLKHPSSHVNFI